MVDTKEIRNIKAQLGDLGMMLLVAFGIPLTVSSLLRIPATGWLFNYGVQIAILFIIGILALLRKRISNIFKINVLIVAMMVISLQTVYTFGLIGSSSVFMVALGVLLFLLSGVKRSVIILAVTMFLYLLILYGHASGIISMGFDLHKYLTSPASWMIHAITVSFVITLLVIMEVTVFGHVNTLVGEQKAANDKLRDVNYKIQNEIDSRIAAEKLLDESEQRYRLLVDNMPSGVWARSADDEFVFVSQNASALIGYTSEELQVEGVRKQAERIHPDDYDKVAEAYSALMKQCIPYDIEFRFLHKNNTWIWLNDRAAIDEHATGKRISYGVFSVITSRKLNELALAESEHKYKQLFESTQDAVLVIQNDQIVDCNRRAAEMFECKKSDLLLHKMLDLSPDCQPDGTASLTLSEQYINDAVSGKKQLFEWIFRTMKKKEVFTEIQFSTLTTGNESFLLAFVRDITERKDAEKNLRRSEAVYRKLFEGVSDGIVYVNEDGCILDCNSAYATMLGYTIDELRAMKFYDLSPEKYSESERIKKTKAEFQDTGRCRPYEKEYIRKDGTRFPVEVSTYTMRLERDEPLVVCGLVRDITERKKVEEAIIESERRFRRLSENAQVGIFRACLVPEFHFEFVNKKMTEIYGYTAEEFYQFPNVDGMDVDKGDLERINGLIADRSRWPGPNVLIVKRKDRNEVWTEVSMVPVKDADGNVVYLEGILQDITERYRAQLDLLESEVRYKTIFNTISDGLIVFDKKGNVVEVNKVFQLTSQFCEQELKTCTVQELLPEVYRHKVNEFIETVSKGEQFFAEVAMLTKNNESVDVEVRGTQIKLKGLRYYLALVRNMTEHKQLRHQLLQAEKMATLGVLVSGVAHEINNPNNFIKLNAKIIEQAWADVTPHLDEYAQEHGPFTVANVPYTEARDQILAFAKGVSEGATRIKNIVNTLKDFARKDTGDISQPVDLSAVIDSSRLILANVLKNEAAFVTVDCPPGKVIVRGNSQQLEQVVINILTNAVQALPSKDCGIYITASSRSDGYALLAVRDEGVGVDEENFKKLFDPFYTTKRDSGGTGLGLSICYAIISNHQGTIDVTSEKGHGTTMNILLPLYTM